MAELRERRALTLRELSEMSGVAADTINQIELGHRRARPSTLRKLARALEVDVREFFEEPALAGKAEAPREAGPTLNPEAPVNAFDVAYTLAQEEAKVARQAYNRAEEAQGIPQSIPVDWQDRLEEQMAELYPDPRYRYSRLLNGFLYGAMHVVSLEKRIAWLEEELATLREHEQAHS